MTPHIRNEMMESYNNGTLRRADVEAVEAHLRACPDCRHRFLPDEQVPVAAAVLHDALRPEEKAPEHLDYEQMRAYIHGETDPIDRLLFDEHLSECLFCRANLSDLEQLTADRSPRAYRPEQFKSKLPARSARASRRFTGWRLAAPLAGATALAALVSVLAFHRPSTGPAMVAREPSAVATTPRQSASPVPMPMRSEEPRHRAVSVPPPKQTTPKPAERPTKIGRTEHGSSTPRRATRPVTPPEQPPAPKPSRPVLVASLPGDAPDLPTWARQDLRRLESTPPVSRSDAEPAAPPIRLISPDPGNASLVGDRPTFAWAPVPNAASYTAVLTSVPEDIDEAPREIESVTVSRPAYQPSQALERGRRYRLTVRTQATQDARTDAALMGTEPVETTWLFRVLSADEARQAQWAEANATKQPIPAAMALYRLDRLADAARIAGNWPDVERLAGWEAALTRLAEQRRADPSE